MKDSGVEWIGEIPEDWEVKPLKHLVSINDDTLSEATPDDFEFDYIDIGSVEYGKGIQSLESMTFAKAPSRARRIVKSGDIIVSTVRTYLKAIAVIPSWERNLIASTGFAVIRSTGDIEQEYLNYAIQSEQFLSEITKRSRGVSYPAVNTSDLEQIKIVLPVKLERSKIIQHLDKRTKAIDEVVTTIKNQLSDLEEYKKSMITEAVTKGLDKDAEMKDSGIEWIGEIPKDWSTPIAKYHVDIFNGSDPLEEGEVPVYGSGDAIFKYSKEYKIGPTVLLGRKGTIENPKYIEGKYWNVDTAFDVKTKNTLDLKFYFYLANLFDYKKYITSTALPSMTKENYENMRLPYPSIIEQEEIVAYLDKKTQAIDEVIAIKQNQLSLLDEYKKSLIYEYVTGKREV